MDRTQESFATAMLIRDLYARCMNRISGETATCGMTAQQLTVISLVAHRHTIQIDELCHEMALTKSTISGILNRMEAMELIERFKETGDQRNTFIRFTPKGQAFATRFRDGIVDVFDHVFANFSDEELSQARSALTAVRDRMQGA